MKKKIIALSALLIAAVMIIGMVSCNKEDETPVFNISTLVSGSIDLNGATPPSDVSPTPNIVATFNIDVDPATVTSSTVTLTRGYDNAVMALTLTVSGKTITIVPNDNLGNGAGYTLSFLAGILATDGQALTPFNRSFATEGTFVPAGQVAYWNFEGNANDQVGSFNPSANGIVNLTYAASYKTDAGQCAVFDGTSTIVEIPNGDQLDNTDNFTLAFWVKTNSVGHVNENGDPKGHFVMGLGAFYGFQFEIAGDYTWCKLAASYECGDGTTASEDLWFNGDGKTYANGGWQGWTFCKDLTGSGGVEGIIKDKWTHVVCVYDAATKVGTMYLNGEKMKAQDFNLWPDGDKKQTIVGLKYGGSEPDVVNELAFGFIQSRAGTMWDTEPWGGYDIPTSNHFGGWLDDVRIFHKALTETEVGLMYNSEKP